MNLGNQVVKKKSFIRKIFKGEGSGSSDFPEPHSNPAVDAQLISGTKLQSLRVFAATWNVGGKSPDSLDNGLNLDDLLQVNNETDIYVLGFQETIPLNTGNVLVLEDNEPATKWLSLINQSLNKSPDGSSKSKASGSLFSSKPSLKKFSKTLRTESKKRLKSCNCTPDEDDESNDFDISEMFMLSISDHLKYSLIASKQLVGIFITIWARKEHIPFVSHLKISRINRGIMGCLGNKGCISVRFLFHQTSFCFVCSHLASGEKEGDELKRNQDVSETIKNTQFPDICKTTHSRMPDNILGHDVVIWLGDLNYRIALSYSKTRQLLNNNDLNALLDKDQLNIEREAERVFKGWKEGKICFAPTYKYSYNSDAYLGETET